MVPIIGTFTPSGITKEQADDINKKLDELLSFIESKLLKTEVLFSKVLERESITQDKFDELMNMLREFGRQKGFKVK